MKDNFENEFSIYDVIFFESSRGVGNNYNLAKGRGKGVSNSIKKCICVGCGREIESNGIPLCSQCKTSKTFDHF